MQSKTTILIAACAVLGAILANSDHPPNPAVAEQSTVQFDYGDGNGKAPEPIPEPVQPFEATPPRETVGAEITTQPVASAFDDVPPVPAVVDDAPAVRASASAFSPSPKESAAGVDFTQNVVEIRTTNGYGGTAVAVAPDTLLTVHHVARYSSAQVAIGGQWVNATVTHPADADDAWRDGAIVKVQGSNLPVMNVRAPVYYEPVTVYGMKTRTKMRGFVSASRYVSLSPESRGIEQGDSGGAVVAADGSLVGIISGNEGQSMNVPPNNRVVAMTRADYLLPYLPRRQAAAQAGGVPQPVGSVFPESQPSAFDPPPAVNSNRANCATPYQAPVQSQQTQPQVYYGACNSQQQVYYVQRRGLFGITRQVRVK